MSSDSKKPEGENNTPRHVQEPIPAIAPTSYKPGSEEKIKVMRKRYLKGEYLYHPKDMTLGGE